MNLELESLKKRRAELEASRINLLMQANAAAGAVQILDELIAEAEKPEPVKEPE